MPIETEIKFRVGDLAALADRLEFAGFRLETPRSFEANTLYDTPDRQMRARTEILRIRSYAGRWTLTHKRLPAVQASRLKTVTSIALKPRPRSRTANALAEFFSEPWPGRRVSL
jgi:adenylate cyclase, class 2